MQESVSGNNFRHLAVFLRFSSRVRNNPIGSTKNHLCLEPLNVILLILVAEDSKTGPRRRDFGPKLVQNI